MSLYKELSSSIDDVIANANETDDFKKQFARLIENFFGSNSTDSDISDVIELVRLPEA